ncbi:AMP-binding protein [Chitinimonas lacunae]|uniref:AMP-binding protein n=1 Tax=Chitinimonas lacunae TaxID=1963018 RepID=A0ABV8MLV9_9NEIS
MSDFIALARLLAQPRLDAHTVAWRNGRPLPFPEFAAQAAAWYALFAAEPALRFALYLDDSAQFAAALFGAWHAGKTVYLPGDAKPATLRRLALEVDGFAGDLPAEFEPLQTPDPAPAPSWGALDERRAALIVFTSGSNGEPASIPKRLSQLAREVESLEAQFGAPLGDAVVHGTVSHQHIYGLLFRVLWPLCAGRAFNARVLTFPEEIATALARGPAVLIASPAHLKRLPDNPGWAEAAAQLRAIFSSGGPLSAEASAHVEKLLGLAPTEVYGSSETGGIASRRRQQGRDAPWQPLPGVALRVDPATRLLYVRSPHLPDNVWIDTADRARIDGAGLVLEGRADRIVKIDDKRISLTALEKTLSASPLLQDARLIMLEGGRPALAVVAVPSEAGWELFHGEGKRALNQALRALLIDSIEARVLPRRWRYVWSMPVNSQGKTTQAMLSALFDPRRPHARPVARTSETVTLALTISARHPYLRSHPEAPPVVPAVAPLEWAELFGREFFALPPDFQRMEAVEFPQPISPGATVTLQLDFVEADGCLGFTIDSEQGRHASGRLYFGSGR